MRFARLLVAFPAAIVAPCFFGCGDPVPPTPRGAFTVNFVDTGTQCQIAGHGVQVGDVSTTTKTAVVTDGQGGADVSCTVKASGSGFSVAARALQGANSLDMRVTLSTSATKDNPAQGKVAFTSAQTVDTYFSPADTPCTFYFFPGSGQGVADGRVWVTFDCPKVDLGQPDTACALKDSVAIFENCVGSSDEDD